MSKVTTYSTSETATNKLTNGTKFSNAGSVVCNVKNGTAYVFMEVTPSSDVVNGDIVVSGLPAPFGGGLYTSLGTASGYSYTALLNNIGELKIYFPAYVTANRIDASFSYVVAE